MKERGSKKRGLSKRAVVILVIIAIVLASFAIAYNYFDLDKKIPTDSENEKLTDSSGGKVGVVILPPEIEDRGADNGSG